MSYDISLTDPVTAHTLQLDAPHHMRGGTYQAGGTTDAHLNITWNYGPHYYRVFPKRPSIPGTDENYHTADGKVSGIRSIYGMTGAQSIPVLQGAIDQLGDDTHPDYWEPTEGNAKSALVQLQALAHMRPDGVWRGD